MHSHASQSHAWTTRPRAVRNASLQTDCDSLRTLVDEVRRRPLTHEEARAVTALLRTIRRLLPDEEFL